MPFSWVKVSSHTSPKILECLDGDTTKRHFEECVRKIVAADGGGVESVWFEQNGKLAHVHIYWETPQQKQQIVLDLEAEDVIDLLSPAEVDDLIHEREAGS